MFLLLLLVVVFFSGLASAGVIFSHNHHIVGLFPLWLQNLQSTQHWCHSLGFYRKLGQFITYIENGTEGRLCEVRTDRREDHSADLPDVSARLGQQGQQNIHHNLHPLRLQV